MHPKFLLLLAILLILSLFASVSADENEADLQVEAFRLEIFDALNDLRKQYGVGELIFDTQLLTTAQRQAEYLAELGKLQITGPAGETLTDRAKDAGYGGSKAFSIHETNAMIWVDTDVNYLVEQVWRKSQAAVRVIFDPDVRQIGIGIADAPDLHRYVVLTVAGLSDGKLDYSMTEPTYDNRTPKPTISATPTLQPLITSTPNEDGGVYHIVQEGETFSEIALAYGLDWYTLSMRNNITLSDTTPVVIMEGQRLVIEPTFTLTPTPTPTKTPLPPTNTPRPTFTPDPNAAPTLVPTEVRLPAPDLISVLARASAWKRTVGWILIGICVPGVILAWRRRK